MRSRALLRAAPPVFCIVLLVLAIAREQRRRTAADLPATPTNMTQLQLAVAGLSSVGCSVWGAHLSLGETSARQYGTDELGRPQSCLSCQCSVKSEEADLEPHCVVFNCPAHMCDEENEYDYEPEHPCCALCNNTPGSVPPPSPPPRAIDAAIPVTGQLYDAVFVHEPSAVCADPDGLALLGVVSRPRSSDRRALFRRLYGAQLAAARIRFVFVLGRETHVARAANQLPADEDEYDLYELEPPTPEELQEEARQHAAWQRAVDAESARHGDILQSRTPEHYNHLSLKTLTLLDFARRHCRRLAFVVKTDDDVLVTVRRLASEVAARAALAHRPVVFGHLCADCLPSRGAFAWRSTHREWPWDQYPPFVLGPGYLVSAGAVEPLLERALRTRYHHLEDVFVTGIVAEAAGVRRQQWDAQCTNRVRGGDLCALSHCALSHPERYEDGGERVAMFNFALQRFDVDELCASNVTMIDA